MELIDKEKIVAEIEKLKAYLQIPNAQLEAIKVCDNVISVLNTLEVKEVDLGNYVHGTIDYPIIGSDFPNIYPNYKELKNYCNRKSIKDGDRVRLIIIKEK